MFASAIVQVSVATVPMNVFVRAVCVTLLVAAPSQAATVAASRGRAATDSLDQRDTKRNNLRSSGFGADQDHFSSLSEVAAAAASVVSFREDGIVAAAPSPPVVMPQALVDVSPPLAECLKLNGEKCYRHQTVWGPPAWFFLHSMTMALPEKVPPAQQEKLRQFMNALPSVLPCPSCGKHLAENLALHPVEPALASRDTMVDWMIGLHNTVNKRCGKREFSRDEVVQKYNQAFAAGSASVLIPAGQSKATVSHGIWMAAICVVVSVLMA